MYKTNNNSARGAGGVRRKPGPDRAGPFRAVPGRTGRERAEVGAGGGMPAVEEVEEVFCMIIISLLLLVVLIRYKLVMVVHTLQVVLQ
jgi:hypothetical protein